MSIALKFKILVSWHPQLALGYVSGQQMNNPLCNPAEHWLIFHLNVISVASERCCDDTSLCYSREKPSGQRSHTCHRSAWDSKCCAQPRRSGHARPWLDRCLHWLEWQPLCFPTRRSPRWSKAAPERVTAVNTSQQLNRYIWLRNNSTRSTDGGAVYLEVEVQGIDHICSRRKTLANEKWPSWLFDWLKYSQPRMALMYSTKPDRFATTFHNYIREALSLSGSSNGIGISWEAWQRGLLPSTTRLPGSKGYTCPF